MATARMAISADARRGLPSVDRLLRHPAVERLSRLYGRAATRVQARQELAALRTDLAAGDPASAEALVRRVDELPARLAAAVEARFGGELARILNATGIFLHTNLGRSPLPREVACRLAPLLDAACDLEFDAASGRRSERNRRADRLLAELTGAPAALVANNNAAALLLCLATLAAGREVVISRGELVEIGGSFRIPEVLCAAGARLVEVGTTNRTRLADYLAAIGPETALLLKVFPSNYRIRGFVAAVGPAELARAARERGVPLLVDEGSGLLVPHAAPQLARHPSLRELIAAGCDLACGSGDKLAGGPQAGLLVGRSELIARCRRHPLYRALRPGRLTYAALEAVLRLHLARVQPGEAAPPPLPLDRMWPDPETHRRRLEALARRLHAEVVPADGFLGGGSAPEAPIPGLVLALAGDEDLAARLRRGRPPVVGYLAGGRLRLDLRTVEPRDDETLAAAVEAAWRAS